MSGDWVLFKVDGKNCIELYLKSVGYICQIDSCQLLGDGRYGWPCHCLKDTDPGYCVILICEDLYQNQSIGRELTAPDTNCIVKSLYH